MEGLQLMLALAFSERVRLWQFRCAGIAPRLRDGDWSAASWSWLARQHPHRSGIHREAPRLSSRPEQSPEMLVLIMAAIVAQLSGSAISQEEADSKNHPNQHNG